MTNLRRFGAAFLLLVALQVVQTAECTPTSLAPKDPGASYGLMVDPLG